MAPSQEPIAQLPTNALPLAYARYLAEVLGADIEENILQAARVSRTEMSNMLRFLCQPSFAGDVSRDRPYIIADDIISSAGGLAILRSHIVRNGGRVIATTALGSRSGGHEQFSVAQETLDVLKSLYGDELDPFWEGVIGHELRCLTEAEGGFLAGWGRDCCDRDGVGTGAELLQRLRTRLNQAAAKGR